MRRNFKSYIRSINIFENNLSLLNKIFQTKINNKFHVFFLTHLVSWQKKDSINSNLLNIYDKKNSYFYKIFIKNIFFFFKLLIFFFFSIVIKIFSHFIAKNIDNKKFLINFPRPNDSFYERDVNLSNKIENSITFEFIYTFREIFLIKKKFFIFIKYISFLDILRLLSETILIFFKFILIQNSKKNIKVIHLLNINDYNFFNFFLKLLQLKIIINCIKAHKINSIISNSLPTSVDSKIFNYISNKLNIKYCCFITKLICKNNLGYRFPKNKEIYPNFYFINSKQNANILKYNNYKINNYFLFQNKKTKLFANSKRFKDRNTILFILTRNSNENKKLIDILSFLSKKKKNVNLYYKYHPQSNLNSKDKLFLENNAKNISDFSNNNIEKIFMNNFNKKIVITTFSSYVYKIVNLGFVPIWVKGFGDIDYLFKDITKNLGFEINASKNFQFIEKKINEILRKKKIKNSNKNFYKSDYIKCRDFEIFLKNFDSIYDG